MAVNLNRWTGAIDSVRTALTGIRRGSEPLQGVIQRWCSDAQAALFHLDRPAAPPLLIGVLGGTGTGKSTIVNRLVEREVTAASFRRTFTGGAIAVLSQPGHPAPDWLGLPHQPASHLPVRGQAGVLTLATASHRLLDAAVLIDTPDVDGDAPAHAAQADRVFRWSQAALFVVTPEKYQMPELLPYYRLARRYAVPALFVLNKCEEQAVLEDCRQELARLEWADARLYAIPRDDAAYEPPPQAGLADLREALAALAPAAGDERVSGLRRRCEDLLSRLLDQILTPLRRERREADAALDALRRLRAPAGTPDVSPLTEQLQRRMQEQSVLYLMGPGRVLDRVRSLPALLARLPRTAWDLVRGGQRHAAPPPAPPSQVPDFQAILGEQLTIVQSRIDDLLRSSGLAACIERDADGYARTRIAAAEASRIAQEELAELQRWLEEHWDRAPRDTRMIEKVLRILPGGARLTKWSEAAPYLLAIIVATHHAFFGPIDLLILGSFSLAAWLGEKATNEVAGRTRLANRRMAERFDALAREQVERVMGWVDAQALCERDLQKLESAADRLGALLSD